MRLPIRLRLALFSGVLIAAVVAALGTFVYLRLEGDLRAAVDDGLAERAQELVDNPPESDEISGGSSDIGDVFALIVNIDTGAVVAATDGLERQTPTVLQTALYNRVLRPTYFEFDVPSDEGPTDTRVLAVSGAPHEVVVTGVAFDDQRATLDSLRLQLILAFPVAVLLAMATGWLVGGAALRPVERMRVEAEAISESEPERRLSVPDSRDELAALGASLNRMLDRLQTAVDRERRVVDNASHELRTPLANLKAELDLALRRARTEAELMAALKSASAETDRLSRLASDLLILARADRGRLRIQPTAIDIEHLVAASVAAFEVTASEAGLRLAVVVEPGLRATLDEPRMRQALDNMLDNAIRHAGRGGQVEVVAALRDRQFRLRVNDSGPGFAAQGLERAFEPFSGDGTGLGLAIVKAVAEAHGGKASAANRSEGGAEVSLTIPQ